MFLLLGFLHTFLNSNGFIMSKEKFNPPSDIEKYHTLKVAQKIKNEYLKLL